MLTNYLLLGLLLSGTSFATAFQYPEDRLYTNADQGYTQYGGNSLHGTGKFALTFDDGPHPTRTPQLLNTLKKHKVKAIFFVITSQINNATFPLIKRMLDEGHLVGSHGKFHDNSDNIPKAEWKSKVKKSFQELAGWYRKAGHVLDKPFYRFPYAAYGHRADHHQINSLKEISQELMNGNCIQFTFWDIDSGDWIPKMTGKEVLSNFKANVEGGNFITYKTVRGPHGKYQIKVPTLIKDPLNGGVILQHDIQQSTIDGTELVFNYAEERGIRFLRIDEVEEFEVTKDCKLE
jgi:peptidoglycan-N-acetylglucosamine deacetylase